MRFLLAHRALRRLVTVPAVVLTAFFVVTTLPLWVVAAAAVSPSLPGRLRPLRLLWFGLVYLVLEAVLVLLLGLLWLTSGFGSRLRSPAYRRVHYQLMRRLLDLLVRTARRTFNLRTDIAAPALPAPGGQPRPVLVLSRHAGPGDSFLLAHELLSVYERAPCIVLRDTLQLDPVFDVLLNRLPSQFVPAAPALGAKVADTIGALAAGLGPDQALVIFPEGANFTERRRRRAIERLEQRGQHEQAAQARRLRQLLPPRPAGALAAIASAPGADVVFVAHTGLEHLVTVRDLWRGLPMDSKIKARFWTVPAREVPGERQAQIDWLYRCWVRLDAWIAANRRSPPAAGTAGPGAGGAIARPATDAGVATPPTARQDGASDRQRTGASVSDTAPATVDDLLRLGTGFTPDERHRIVSWLQPLDARLRRYPADRVDLEISVKGRGGPRPEMRLIAHIHGSGAEPKVHLVATSTAARPADGALQDAVLECRDDLRRRLDDHVTRNEARRRR